MFNPINLPQKNSTERAVSRTLLQFRNSPVFISILAAFISEVQALLNTIQQVIKMRGPAEAQGEQLDALGRIVGQPRTLVGFDAIEWFAPDRNFQGADASPVWVRNAPVSENFIAGDFWYRQLIEGKVARNHIKYASVPEIQNFVKQAFNVDISIVRTDVMTVQVIVHPNTDNNTMLLFERYEMTETAEKVYFLPFAAGVQIASVIKVEEDSSS